MIEQTTINQLREIFLQVRHCGWGCGCCASDPEDIDKELEDVFQELLAVLSNNTKGQK